MSTIIQAVTEGDEKTILTLMRAVSHPVTGRDVSRMRAAQKAGQDGISAIAALMMGRREGSWAAMIDAEIPVRTAWASEYLVRRAGVLNKVACAPPPILLASTRNGMGWERVLALHQLVAPDEKALNRAARKAIVKASHLFQKDLFSDGAVTGRKVMRADGGRVLLITGLPGSGKSTLASGSDLPILGYDTVRSRDPHYVRDPKSEACTMKQALRELDQALREDRTVVWDATGLNAKARALPLTVAKDRQARVSILSLDIPFRVAAERNATRGARKVPESLMRIFGMQRRMVSASESSDLISINAAGQADLLFGDSSDLVPIALRDSALAP